MPGICGIIDTRPARDNLTRAVGAMQHGLAHEPWHVRRSHVAEEAGLALASVALGFGQQAKLVWEEDSASGIVLDGELYASQGDHARQLLAGWLSEGAAYLRRLHGSFAAAIWDGRQRRLVLITDRFATRPVYVCESESGLRFASGIAALLAGQSGPREVNPRGLAQFFTFGHYLRDDTALAGVRVLPAAACCTFDAGAGRWSESTYWTLAKAEGGLPATHGEWLERIDDTFTAAVRRCTDDTPHLGLALSGGLDARTILGVMDIEQTPVQTVCLGVCGSLDHRASAELARLAGCPYHAHVLDAGFLGQFREHLERMVQLTDGQYLSQCIVIPTLSVYRDLGIQTLLRGHSGELLHMHKAYNYSLDAGALEIRTGQQLREWLFRRLQAYMLDNVTEPLFAPPYQAGLQELAAGSLDADLHEADDGGPPLNRIWRLFVQQRLRRETVLSLLKFRSVVEPRLPYLDADLIPLLLAAPPEMKLGEEIQSHILRRHRPAFLNVTNANTGTRVGGSRLARRVATLQMKVLAKLGVPGYQPYERLGLWLRRELAPLVREILLAPQTLDRGIYEPAGIQAVVRQHLEEGRNHTFLLMALMIFELGLRRLVDGRISLSDAASITAAVA